uniref:(northern house mosquito) hypothetical protein n=1 Tax=Culex pipiens TaxID=7175 RepID=A0A8D8MNV3_CULPI
MRNRRKLCKTRNCDAIFHREEIKQPLKNVCNVSGKTIQQLCSDSFLIDILSKKIVSQHIGRKQAQNRNKLNATSLLKKRQLKLSSLKCFFFHNDFRILFVPAVLLVG